MLKLELGTNLKSWKNKKPFSFSLASFTEKSSRYQLFDNDCYYTPKIDEQELYLKTCDFLFEKYKEVYETLLLFFKKKYRATAIFLKAESLLMIKKRLLGREPNMSLIELKKRLDNATKEIKKEEKYYDYVIINRQNKINETIKKIESILKKEGYWLNKN